MSQSALHKQINILESAAMLVLEECHKTRTMLAGADRPASRKGREDHSLAKEKRDRMNRMKKKQS